jgi:GH35 family endo-1,4-beta-xylanase
MKRQLLLTMLVFLIPAGLISQELQDWGEYENIKKEAIKRIEQNRKGDAKLIIILPDNEIAAKTEVNVKLKRHDFKWGAVVSPNFINSPYSEKHKENFLKYFNATGFNVALKPKQRGNQNEKFAEAILPWFLENDIFVRGHTLAWEGEKFIREEQKKIYNDKSLTDLEKGNMLLESFAVHFPHAIPKWDVKCWDVSNEPLANNIINDLLPEMNTHVHWFKLADSIRRSCGKQDLTLFQNDYQIISAILPWALEAKKEGYKAVGRPAIYREILDEQIALGAPIEGIGFQSRLKGGLITPDTIYNRLCDFERYKLPYHATEFEIRDSEKFYTYTDEERRILTEYMMIMYFSHPNVEGFWHWTLADYSENKTLDFPLFNYDGTPKVNGEKWIELMEGFLNMNEVLETNKKGEVDVRGYYGSYEIEVEIDGEILRGIFDIDRNICKPVVKVNVE